MQKHKTICRACDRKIVFEERHLGRVIACPNCQQPVRLGKRPASSQPSSQSSVKSQSTDKAKSVGSTNLSDTTQSSGKTKSSPSTSRKSPSKRTSKSAPAAANSVDEGFDLDWLGTDVGAESYTAESETPLPPIPRKKIRKPKSAKADSTTDATVAPTRGSSQRPQSEREPTKAGASRWLIYGLFFATLIPLGISVLGSDEQDTETRFEETLVEALEDPVVIAALESAESPDELFNTLPDHRIKGAYLAKDTWLHWGFAGLSGAGFLALILLLFRRFSEDLGGAVIGAIFTATAGIILLIGLQWAAFASQGIWIRGRGIFVLLFYIVKLIGFSYSCALQDGNGFLLSFFGFTIGVGICEEVCKVLPVIVYLGTAKKPTWQGASLVGLASGIGFGVSEGIMYSSEYYNGISTGQIYIVRFVSCVALHSVWSGAGAMLLFGHQDAVHSNDYGALVPALAITLGVPIVLHGLYDTLLKQDGATAALVVGVLSVAWLIAIVESLTRREQAQWA